MQPAAPARGIVTFANVRGSLESLTLAADLEVLAGQLPFRTQDALDVLPVEAKVYYKRALTEERQAEVRDLYTKLYGGAGDADNLAFYETTPLEPPVDASSLHRRRPRGGYGGRLPVGRALGPAKETPQAARPCHRGRVLTLASAGGRERGRTSTRWAASRPIDGHRSPLRSHRPGRSGDGAPLYERLDTRVGSRTSSASRAS